MRKIYLIRHAMPDIPIGERWCIGGQTDIPLGKLGCLQAALLPFVPELDGVETVFCSTLIRARETARPLCPESVPVPGLEEYDFGIFEGKSYRDMEHDLAYRAWVDGGCVGTCPGGESRAEFVARSNAAFASLLRRAAAHDEREVTVVAHGGTIMAAFSSFAHDAPGTVPPGIDDYFAWQVGTCEGYVATVSIDGDRIQLLDAERFERLPAWPY